MSQTIDEIQADIRRIIASDPVLKAIDVKIEPSKNGSSLSPTRHLSPDERVTYFTGKLEPLFIKLIKLNAERLKNKPQHAG